MPQEQGKRLAKDLETFAATWISNPAAKLDFARLIERVISTVDPYPVREWIAESKETARYLRLGVG